MEASSFDTVYCYPGTEVLINNFGEHDPKVLSQLERMCTAARIVDLLKKPVSGNFDLTHLKRSITIYFRISILGQDSSVWLISPKSYYSAMLTLLKRTEQVILKLKSENYLKDCTEDNIASKAAYYLGEINAIHPFREGNGRTQREFIRELLLPTGFYVDYSRCNAK